MDDRSLDDVALVRRAAAGERAALEQIYERYAPPLYAFIGHHLEGRRPDVEEIWSETLLAALRSLGKYAGRAGFFTWLCGIARRKIIDHWERAGRAPMVLSETAEADLECVVDTARLPEEVVDQKETRLRVVAALAELPVEYQRVLTSRYADGKSVSEVAALLGKTYKATESLLSRARSEFRAAFGGFCD